MKNLISKVYSNRTIVVAGETIKFKDTVAEVSESVFKKVMESKFPNIFSSDQDIPKNQSQVQKELDDDVALLNEEYKAEIDRLKGIIEEKIKTIGALGKEIENWKKEVEKRKGTPTPKETKEGKPKEKPSETELKKEEYRKEFENCSLEELKEYAVQEEIALDKYSSLSTKEEMIEFLVDFCMTLLK